MKCSVCGFESEHDENFSVIIGDRFRLKRTAAIFGEGIIAICQPCYLRALGVKPKENTETSPSDMAGNITLPSSYRVITQETFVRETFETDLPYTVPADSIVTRLDFLNNKIYDTREYRKE